MVSIILPLVSLILTRYISEGLPFRSIFTDWSKLVRNGSERLLIYDSIPPKNDLYQCSLKKVCVKVSKNGDEEALK